MDCFYLKKAFKRETLCFTDLVVSPDDEEDEYGEEETEGPAHDPGDDAKVLLQVDQDHGVAVGAEDAAAAGGGPVAAGGPKK